MASVTTTAPSKPPVQERGTFSKKFNFNYFVQDNVTGSRGLIIWVSFLALINLGLLFQQFNNAPGRTWIIFGIWAVTVLGTVVGELFTLHIGATRWLKENMFNSVSNALLTLLLALLVGIVVAGLWSWGVVNATFDPQLTHPDVRTFDGASWGVIWGARKLLLTGLLEPEQSWRVILWTVTILALWALSFIGTREQTRETRWGTLVRQFANVGWLLSPFLSYIFLAGLEYTEPFIDPRRLIIGTIVFSAIMGILWFFKVIQLTPITTALWVLSWPAAYLMWRGITLWNANAELFTTIDPDRWGGLLLTVIFAIFVNLLSFPIGILLALGRRADVQGIPWWILWPVAIGLTAWGLYSSTFGNCIGTIPALCENVNLWATSRNTVEQIVAFWPLLIPLATWAFLRSFNGNFLQAFSVLFIEIIRGVPLITLLFMAIIMAPFFLPEDSQGLSNFWAVIVGYTIFTSSYTAELVRGGLQAIPKGQYEAADSLGINTLQKYRFIILPQALRILIPPLAGAVIGTFKSSSLVALVGMIDLVGSTKAIIANSQWLGLRTELYVFMFVLYFLVSSIVSWYSRRLEERTGLGVR